MNITNYKLEILNLKSNENWQVRNHMFLGLLIAGEIELVSEIIDSFLVVYFDIPKTLSFTRKK